jgi:hypothetical protein
MGDLKPGSLNRLIPVKSNRDMKKDNILLPVRTNLNLLSFNLNRDCNYFADMLLSATTVVKHASINVSPPMDNTA